jgi:DNA replication protein DnaC
LRLLQKESDYRLEIARILRIKKATFPEEKYLENLIIHKLHPHRQNKLKVLKSLDFIERGQNVIMTGTGKTHISIDLGIKACNKGYCVLFTKVPLLITQLKENVIQKSLRSLYCNLL